MNRTLLSFATCVLLVMPPAGLGGIGMAFLSSSNERSKEFEPIAVDTLGPEPQLVPLFTERRNAWMQASPEFGGWAHVRRAPTGEIIVLSACHPRMGDFISYESTLGCFQSDCFHSRFDLDGRWFHVPNESMHRVPDMLQLDHRIDDGKLFIRAPIPRATYFTEVD